MMNIGPIEILILLVGGVVTLAVPVATLVLLFLIFDKVKRIEERLNQRE
jgi:hypothetical protein